jgi:hypothetical protein
MDSNMTCKVCGDVRHSGNSCPETQEDLNFVNTDNRYNIKARISAPTTREVTIITLLLV